MQVLQSRPLCPEDLVGQLQAVAELWYEVREQWRWPRCAVRPVAIAPKPTAEAEPKVEVEPTAEAEPTAEVSCAFIGLDIIPQRRHAPTSYQHACSGVSSFACHRNSRRSSWGTCSRS